MTPHDWIAQHYDRLRVYAMYACQGQVEQAEELLQETILKILDGRVTLDLTRSPLTWCQRVMQRDRWRVAHGKDYRTVLEEVEVPGQALPQGVEGPPPPPTKKKRQVFQSLYLYVGEALEKTPSHEPGDSSRDDGVCRLIAGLNPKLQDVMWRVRLGMGHTEIGLELGLHPDAVQKRYSKAIQTMRAQVQREDAASGDQGRGGSAR